MIELRTRSAPPSGERATLFDPGQAGEPEALLGPPRPLPASISPDRLEDYNLSVLLALALADGYRELNRASRRETRLLLEGQLGLVLAMTRLEPKVSAFLEDTQRWKQAIEEMVTALSKGKEAVAKLKAAGAGQRFSELVSRLKARSPAFARLSDRLEARLGRKPDDARDRPAAQEGQRARAEDQRSRRAEQEKPDGGEQEQELTPLERLVLRLETAVQTASQLWDTGWSDDGPLPGTLAEGRKLQEEIFDGWFGDYLAEKRELLVRLGELVDVVTQAEAISRTAEAV